MTRTSSHPRLFAPEQPRPTAPRRPRRAADAPRSPIEVCVLGSGSGGNSTVVRFGPRTVLIDLGLGPRTICRRLAMAEVELDEIGDVFVTHLDRDHLRPTWLRVLLDRRIRLHVHRWHLPDLERLPGAEAFVRSGLLEPFGHEPFELEPNRLSVRPVALAHDVKGTVGYRFDFGDASLAFATDLGHVPAALIEAMTAVNVLAIESNYDPGMQRGSGRPVFLQRRIMGMAGHLSNAQSFEAVARVLDRSPPGMPQHVVLLHISRQCNHPHLVQRIFEHDPRLRGRLTLSEQRRRTRWLKAQPLRPIEREQMVLPF